MYKYISRFQLLFTFPQWDAMLSYVLILYKNGANATRFCCWLLLLLLKERVFSS